MQVFTILIMFTCWLSPHSIIKDPDISPHYPLSSPVVPFYKNVLVISFPLFFLIPNIRENKVVISVLWLFISLCSLFWDVSWAFGELLHCRCISKHWYLMVSSLHVDHVLISVMMSIYHKAAPLMKNENYIYLLVWRISIWKTVRNCTRLGEWQ